MSDGMTLTFKGDNISAKPLTDGLQAFVAVINAVTREMTGSNTAFRWVIHLREGSVAAEFVPQAQESQSVLPADLIDTCERGFVALESGEALPAHFPEAAIPQMRRLAATLNDDNGITAIHVGLDGREYPVTLRMVANIDAMNSEVYRDWGTIDGTLETLTERGGLTFTIYDQLTGRGTVCHFDDDIIEEVSLAFTRRVSVSGLIRYRADGEPLAIDVEEFSVIPREEDLPDIPDMVGIFSGGM